MTLTQVQRTANHRRRRLAAGWTILHCQLPPETANILAGIVKNTGLSRAEVIARLIKNYDENFG